MIPKTNISFHLLNTRQRAIFLKIYFHSKMFLKLKKSFTLNIEDLVMQEVSTVDENIIATIKMRNNICYPLKMVKLDSSILLPI